ncbi:HAD-IIIC family phosphatase [Nonomuraea sp. NPDC049419]|uniref:HAD-IIIC family phosphatase n=1 Tax=Nonomuraea sp. NPDC049419 TaxID=3155772 RepID=UPI003418CC61
MDALLQELRTAVAERRMPPPRTRLALLETADPALARRAGRLLAALPSTPASPQQGAEDAPVVPVTVLATATIGPYEQILRAQLVAAGVLPELTVGQHGSLDRELATGAFARSSPRFVSALMDESLFLPRDWSAAGVTALEEHVRARLAALTRHLPTGGPTLILHTVPMPAELRDGLVSRQARTQVTRLWYELNAALLALAEQHAAVEVVDLAGLLAEEPYAARDDRMHRYGDLPYTDGALLVLAREVRRVVQASLGLSRKVLALDLDGTLWGGVLGEAGAGGVQLGGLYPGNCYSAFQRAVLRLREQGVILVLASKNDAEPVDEALSGHPEMLLRADAFAARAVNWSSKAENLSRVADALGLPPSAFVFVDDTEVERAEVADRFPEIGVVSAAGDPAHLVRRLLRTGWFDAPSLTEADLRRADLYRARAERAEFSDGFEAAADYLRALKIEVEIAPVTPYTVARAAQLAARTNQFNLTGVRFGEAETAELAARPDHLVATVTVSDRFGSDGVVGALWAERGAVTWRVLNLVLSCRVLGRGIETAIAAWLSEQAAESGARTLIGRYVPTKRNRVAAAFWTQAGFTRDGDRDGDGSFVLDLTTGTVDLPGWITMSERSGHE